MATCTALRSFTHNGSEIEPGDTLDVDLSSNEGRLLVRRGFVDPGGSAVQLLHPTLEFDYTDAVALKTGMTLFVPTVGDIVLNVWLEVVTAFDGTTPLVDVGPMIPIEGQPEYGDFYIGGVFGTQSTPVSLAQADTDGAWGEGMRSHSTHIADAITLGVDGPASLVPAKFVGTPNFAVVATQTGQTNGAQLDSTVGAAVAHALILRG